MAVLNYLNLCIRWNIFLNKTMSKQCEDMKIHR